MSSIDKSFWIEFFELYRSHECIWRIKSKSYMDRQKKNEAYEQLLEKLKEREKDATVDTVKKKINNFRSVFRKELKKVNSSIRSGSSADEAYAPSLWYYDHLLFLKDQETTRESITTINEESEHDAIPEETDIPCRSNNLSQQTSRHTSSVLPTPPKKRKSTQNKADHVLDLIAKRLEATQDSECDVFGMYVAKKLENLKITTPSMYPFVKKLINDAIFEGEMSTLTQYSRIVQYQSSSLSSTLVSTQSPTYYQAPSLCSTPVPAPSPNL